ncbi:MAG: hypothetical protein ACREGL_02065 [Alphaproteobacteria bacterium]
MSTAKSASKMIAVAGKLVDVAAREIELLKAMRPSAIQVLQAEKDSLARAYEAELRALRADPEGLAAIEPSLRRELKRVMLWLAEVMAENDRAIRAAREANRRLLRAVVAAAEATRPRASSYTQSGTATQRARSAERALSLSVDRSL